jgi:hypothetical protein
VVFYESALWTDRADDLAVLTVLREVAKKLAARLKSETANGGNRQRFLLSGIPPN